MRWTCKACGEEKLSIDHSVPEYHEDMIASASTTTVCFPGIEATDPVEACHEFAVLLAKERREYSLLLLSTKVFNYEPGKKYCEDCGGPRCPIPGGQWLRCPCIKAIYE